MSSCSKAFHTVVFIHGMWGGEWIFKPWEEACKRFNINTRTVKLHPEEGTSFDHYVWQVRQELSFLRPGPVVLVGHSLGGLIAQKVAETNPDQVKGVVLVASAPSKGIVHAPLFWFRLRYLKAALTGKLFSLCEEDAVKHVLNRLPDTKSAFERFCHESGRVLRDVALGVEIGNIECPVLVIGGREDKILPDSVQAKIARELNASHLSVDMGHMIPLEDKSEKVFGHIVAFMYGVRSV